jgi:hypothetical protein
MDLNDNIEYTKGALIKSSGVGAAVEPTKFNPEFVSQFDINISLVFSKLVYDNEGQGFELSSQFLITPANLLDILKVDLAFFLWGKADSGGGFKRNDQLLTVNNWFFDSQFIKSKNVAIHSLRQPGGVARTFTFASSADLFGRLKRGDALQTYYYFNVVSSTNIEIYLAEIVIECKQVAYGTLLDATSSDRFSVNNIRYKIPDVTKTSQYEKQLKVTRQSLFGKLSTDEISPAAYQKPNQFQTNIVDIPLIKGIDKESSISSYLEYDVGEILLSIFVATQKKLTQNVK